MRTIDDIGCLILAGGKSRRMGRDKAFLEIGSISILERQMEILSIFSERMVSVGASGIDTGSFKAIYDDYAGCGPLSGIHKALITTEKDALFIVACDMPFISAELIHALARSWSKEHCDALICRDSSGKDHPLCGIYSRRIAESIKENLDSGSYRVMDALMKTSYRSISLSTLGFDDTALMNINTVEDYRRALMQLQESGDNTQSSDAYNSLQCSMFSLQED